MRVAILSLFILSVVCLSAPTMTVASTSSVVPITMTANVADGTLGVLDLPKVDVDVDVHKHDRAWYKNPVVIGLGVVIVVLLAALAGRGGGGTAIIDRRG